MVVKPNRSELAKALNVTIESDAALRDAIQQLIAQGPAWAVVSEGKAGAFVSDGQRFWRVRSPAVKAINPIGSGDALAAGLACEKARGGAVPGACTPPAPPGGPHTTDVTAPRVPSGDVA